MNRDAMWAKLQPSNSFDIAIVGGGATGLGCAVDAASRGHSVILLEQHDFAKGTSSRSTKLVHGGVRYLQQGNISLVMESLKERGILRRNAPHLVRDLAFVVPNYSWWEAPYYGFGMKVYDMLAGKYGFGSSTCLSKEQTVEALPTIETEGLRGGVMYYDGQFDDARLAIHLARTAVDNGAVLINYAQVSGLIMEDGAVKGVQFVDLEKRRPYSVRAKATINATGAWCDGLRQMAEPDEPRIIRPSQGVHIVLDRSFLPGESAIMVPRTADGRVLFAIPWHDRVVVGTTDTPVAELCLEPRALPEELEFILEHAQEYLSIDPKFEDIKSVYAGIRPLVASGTGSTASVSRDHTLQIGSTGLITITGGKWTTYRKMAQDTIDTAVKVADLEPHECVTTQLPIHGADPEATRFGRLWFYGRDAEKIIAMMEADRGLSVPIHSGLQMTVAEVLFGIRFEMARTVEDLLARRSRSVLFDARAAWEAAPAVARVLAQELGRSEAWTQGQVHQFRTTAEAYIPDPAAADPAKVSRG
ncbi:MAG: FAD-dependent oxidoreductase [Myxococcota bacterium]